jgi:hypothetical protein
MTNGQITRVANYTGFTVVCSFLQNVSLLALLTILKLS